MEGSFGEKQPLEKYIKDRNKEGNPLPASFVAYLREKEGRPIDPELVKKECEDLQKALRVISELLFLASLHKTNLDVTKSTTLFDLEHVANYAQISAEIKEAVDILTRYDFDGHVKLSELPKVISAKLSQAEEILKKLESEKK